MLPSGRLVRRILPGLLVALACALPAAAHEETAVGPLRMTVGWVEEPAFAGLPNAVEVSLTRGGQPVEEARLTAVVIYGEANSATRTNPLPLDPVAEEPGEYRAFVIPTRPGAYTFEITGRASGKKIDESVTSGPQTFDDVESAADVQFPAQDPSQGELAARLERIDARLEDLRIQVAALGEQGGGAGPWWLGGAGLAVAAFALAVALAARRQRRAA